MKTSKSSARTSKSTSGRTKPTAKAAKPTAKPTAKAAKPTAKKAVASAKRAVKPAAKKAVASAKRAVKPTVKKAVAAVKKAARQVAKKVGAPKDDQTRVHDLLAGFSTVMLLTSEGSGERSQLHARPMAVAKLDDDCTLTFMTGFDTAKVDEAKKDGVGYVIAQGKTVFLSMHGTVEVVRDRNRIHDAWTAVDKIYFPKGKDDPNICLLVLHPASAEVWDVSGAKGIGYLFEAARALVTGTRPRHDATVETHDTIDLTAASAAATGDA
jgi:general stress protein 26